MQINSVGYNNYGYSNQKVQKNNQQSFGMAVGKSLRGELTKRGTEIRALGTDAIAKLQDNLVVLESAPSTAEYLTSIGAFLRDGQRAFVFNGEPPATTDALLNDVRLYSEKATEHAQLKASADKLPGAQKQLEQAQQALGEHNTTFIDNLIGGNFGTHDIHQEVNKVGRDVDLSLANAQSEVNTAENARKALDTNFFNRDIKDEVIAELEGKTVPNDPTSVAATETK